MEYMLGVRCFGDGCADLFRIIRLIRLYVYAIFRIGFSWTTWTANLVVASGQHRTAASLNRTGPTTAPGNLVDGAETVLDGAPQSQSLPMSRISSWCHRKEQPELFLVRTELLRHKYHGLVN